jgi:galactitol-specific phosphotransferase system IIB component
MTAVGEKYDMVFTSKGLLSTFKNSPKPVVVISNFLSEQEIEEKGLPVIRELIGE